MKRLVLACLGLLGAATAPSAQAIEILRWERIPLVVPLQVGQERIVFVNRNVRVGVPASVGQRLRVQSAAGAVYLLAREAIEPTRLQLQDADTGALILLDISTMPDEDGAAALEPIRIEESGAVAPRTGDQGEGTANTQTQGGTRTPRRETPIPVVLTRYAAQNLYAPLRTVEPLPGVTRVNLQRNLKLDTLLPTLPVRASALAAWRLEDMWLTAVRLTNTSGNWITLDPRLLQGDLLASTFHHDTLGPHGTPEDTTVLYVVTQGHGLARSLLPAVHRFDPAIYLTPEAKAHHSEASHEK
ncbi:hypothetical protein ALDI51_31780 [Alicycliphilus denitrificans]|uniref:TIGR03749 family integrating conjugative element protein n=1 Tax=Alicycliphilus denitrificans TaxID=179636 RepID=UPI000961C205|nr:TIGR03749 family integrating conjugative element protein [Alicycliphilus denitrificans]OJW83878.1 MAG: integrating conjugative element protein [Alicycliphilus sp. 69-12]BCN39859.1 hypothetical protein ALDI51_31780 [Alicycliphilus denitrificans]